MSPVGFDKMLPRDNKMFNVSEGFNLKPVPEPSIIEKLAALDIDIRKLKVKDMSMNSSHYSESTSQNTYRVEANKSKSRHIGGGNYGAADFFADMPSKSHLTSKMSLKQQQSEMSLEEKILQGFYKNTNIPLKKQ